MPVDRSPSPTAYAAAAGLVGAAVSLGLGELASGVSRAMPSLVIAVAEVFVDKTPGDATETAIRAVGTSDKPLLIAGIVVVSLAIGAWLGARGLRRRSWIAGGFGVFGLVGGWAAARNPFATAGWAWLSALTAAAAGAVVTIGLLHVFARPVEGRQQVRLGPSTRRAFLVYGTGAAAGAMFAASLGRALRGRQSIEGARLALAARGVDVTGSAADQAVAALESFDSIEGLSSYVTPLTGQGRFYRIDTALAVPQVDPATWRLRVGGLVERPYELTYDELLALPLEEHAITLSCVSNEIGGGLVGNAIWTGVPLRAVLDRAGVKPEGTQIVGRSVDDFTAGFPTEVAYDGRNALLAIAMNGEPLAARHGFPARLVIPGLYGYVSAVKWLRQITLETEAFDGYWVPRGWSKLGPMKTMSRVDVPRDGAKVAAGTVAVAGVAWSPNRGIGAVEVQIDGGDWQPCTLARAVSDETWIQWKLAWTAPPGKHTIAVRAVDKTGAVQPLGPADPRPDGAEGYHRIAIDVR